MTTRATREEHMLDLVKLDYERTTKLVEGLVASNFTIRGWAITLVSGLVGLSFQSRAWQVAALAAFLVLLFALLDVYHGWLYGGVLAQADAIEHVLREKYSALAGDGDDPKRDEDFAVSLRAHTFGRFSRVGQFRLSAIRDARPRVVLIVLYGGLLALSSGAAWLEYGREARARMQLECTQVAGARSEYSCVAK